MKRLGIYCATACYRDEAGRYCTSNGLGRYLQEMHRLFPFEVVLAAPVTTLPLAHLQYPLPAERVRVYELPYFETFLGALWVRNTLRHRLSRFLDAYPVDVVWLHYPRAYAPVLWRECRRRDVPCFFELVGAPVSLLKASPIGSRLKRWTQVQVASMHEREPAAHTANYSRYRHLAVPASKVSGTRVAHIAVSIRSDPIFTCAGILVYPHLCACCLWEH